MKKEKNCCRPHHRHHGKCHGFGFATILIIVGVVLLCTKLNIMPVKYVDILLSWPMILIVIGIISLFKRHFIAALFFIGIGKFFMIPEVGKIPDNFLGNVPPNFIQLYWPALLIFVGVLFILHRITAPSRKFDNIQQRFLHEAERKGHTNKFECENGYVNKDSVFSSSEHIVLDPEFKGGSIHTVFGETKLDLRKTTLGEGTTRLDIDMAFGGIFIYVPADWHVQLHVNSVFGAFEDKRSFKEAGDSTKTLVIYGSIVFSGGEIRN
jgi:predicted membrane protein